MTAEADHTELGQIREECWRKCLVFSFTFNKADAPCVCLIAPPSVPVHAYGPSLALSATWALSVSNFLHCSIKWMCPLEGVGQHLFPHNLMKSTWLGSCFSKPSPPSGSSIYRQSYSCSRWMMNQAQPWRQQTKENRKAPESRGRCQVKDISLPLCTAFLNPEHTLASFYAYARVRVQCPWCKLRHQHSTRTARFFRLHMHISFFVH